MVLVCDPVTVWRTVHCNPALTQWLLRLAPVSLRPWGGRSVGEQMDVFFFCLFWPFCLFASISVASFFSLPSHLVFSPCLMTITCVSFVFLFSLMVGAVTPVCYYHHSSLPDLVGGVELFLSLTRSHGFFFLTPWLHTKRCFLSVCLYRRLDPLTTFEPISTDVWVQDGWVNPFAKNMFRFLLFGPTTLWHHINVHLRSEYTEGFFFFFILVKHNWWLVCWKCCTLHVFLLQKFN